MFLSAKWKKIERDGCEFSNHPVLLKSDFYPWDRPQSDQQNFHAEENHVEKRIIICYLCLIFRDER